MRHYKRECPGKEAPTHFKIPELVVNLCEDLEERLKHLPSPQTDGYILEVVKLLAWFQHKFVFIHEDKILFLKTSNILSLIRNHQKIHNLTIIIE